MKNIYAKLKAKFFLNQEYAEEVKKANELQKEINRLDNLKKHHLEKLLIIKQSIYKRELNHDHVLFGV